MPGLFKKAPGAISQGIKNSPAVKAYQDKVAEINKDTNIFRAAARNVGLGAELAGKAAKFVAQEAAAGASSVGKTVIRAAAGEKVANTFNDAEMEKKIFNRETTNAQDIYEKTQKFVDQNQGTRLERAIFPVIASAGFLATENPLSAPGKKFSSKLVKELAEEVSEDVVRSTIRQSVPGIIKSKRLENALVQNVARETDPAKVSTLLSNAQKLASNRPKTSTVLRREAEAIEKADLPDGGVLLKTGDKYDGADVYDATLDSLITSSREIGDEPIDLERVKYYQDKIRKGEKIEPLRIDNSEEGLLVADGKNRATAYRREGIEFAPVVDNAATKTYQKANDPKTMYGTRKIDDSFKGFNDLSLTTLEKLKGRSVVSKQFISDLTNSPDLKKPEKELIQRMLQEEGPNVDVETFANKVKTELLPLNVKNETFARGPFKARYENVALPNELRGSVSNYKENIYESPIPTKAGYVHFDDWYGSQAPKNYFAHTRIEDMADGETRRVIEAQSDLFQKGRLEMEKGVNTGMSTGLNGSDKMVLDSLFSQIDNTTDEVVKKDLIEKRNNLLQKGRKQELEQVNKKSRELAPLEPYRNTWQDRIIREEIRQAALDGKKKIQFPVGNTAMKVEGLGEDTSFMQLDGRGFIKPDSLEVGLKIKDRNGGNEWIVTDVLGDGKFKAAPDEFITRQFEGDYTQVPPAIKEIFDVSGKADTNNPIYKFYENDVGKFLKNKYQAYRTTDAQGVDWWEVDLTKGNFKDAPVQAFGGVAGIEQDEEGNVTFDPLKAALGALGIGAITKGANKFGLRVSVLKQNPEWENVASTIAAEFDISTSGLKQASDGNGYLRFSTFPQWIPSELRDKKMMNKVLDMIDQGVEPTERATRQTELYELVVEEIEGRMGITRVDVPDGFQETDESLTTLMGVWDENPAKALEESKDFTNAMYSKVTPDGELFATKVLDTLPPIPNTPQKAFDLTEGPDMKPDFEIPQETRIQYIQRQIQDKFNRLGYVQKQITEQTGKDIDERVDAYLQQELYTGRAAEQIDIFRDSLIKSKSKDAPALMERMRKDGITVEDMGEYLQARHAKERNAKVREINEDLPDGGSGMLDSEADEILSKYAGNEKISAYADEFYEKVTKARLKLLQESGLMTPEAIETINSSYKNYVPLKLANMEQFGTRGKGFSVSGKDIKRVKGSTKERTNPLIQAIVDYEDTIIKAEKNKVAQTFAKLVTENPNKDLWEIENLKYMPRFNKEGELIMMDPKYKFADNVMEVRFDGKIKLITVHDKALAQAMKNLGTEKAISKTLVTINNYLRGVTTFYNPEFMITNFERDLQTALINISGEQGTALAAKVARDVAPAMRGIYRNLRGKADNTAPGSRSWSEIFEEMKAEGGRTGWFDTDSVENRTVSTIKLIEKYNGDGSIKSFQRAVDSAANLVSDLNESVEMAVRLSAYKNAVDSGISKRKAAQLAKNLTVNFNKKGNIGTALNSLYLFANAGIQGSARIVTALKHPRTRKIAAGIVGFSYGMAELNRQLNEEQYDRISDYEKDTNLIIMIPQWVNASEINSDTPGIEGDAETGYFFKLKLPYGYNMFKVMGDIAYNQIHQKKEPGEELKHFLSALDSSFNPLSSGSLLQFASPTVLDPIAQQYENKNFSGSPIKPEQSQYGPEKKESSMYFGGASKQSVAVAKWLSDITGGSEVESGLIEISPEIIDHYLDFIGGGVSTLIGNTVDTGLNLSQGELPDVDNMPFIRKFVGTPFEQAEKFDLYDLQEKSATKELSKNEVAKLAKDTRYALEQGQLDEETAKKILKTTLTNQDRIKAGRALSVVLKKGDLASRKEALKDLTPSQVKEFKKLLKEELEERLEQKQKEGK